MATLKASQEHMDCVGVWQLLVKEDSKIKPVGLLLSFLSKADSFETPPPCVCRGEGMLLKKFRGKCSEYKRKVTMLSEQKKV